MWSDCLGFFRNSHWMTQLPRQFITFLTNKNLSFSEEDISEYHEESDFHHKMLWYILYSVFKSLDYFWILSPTQFVDDQACSRLQTTNHPSGLQYSLSCLQLYSLLPFWFHHSPEKQEGVSSFPFLTNPAFQPCRGALPTKEDSRP